jgi:hypothetical protein
VASLLPHDAQVYPWWIAGLLPLEATALRRRISIITPDGHGDIGIIGDQL